MVQKVRIRYAKRGRLRFISHRDFARALERALRRAGAPVAFSAGFSPHPKISYVGAAPTGAASEAEYVEVGLAERVDVEAFAKAVDASLPSGLDVVECVEAGPGSLPDRIDGSAWSVRLPGVPVESAAAAVAAFLAAEAVPVERRTKDGTRTIDARGPIRHAEVRASGDVPPCAILHLVVRHTTPAVRPDDVLSGLRAVAGLDLPAPPEATRSAQGLLDEAGHLADPLAPDRAASAGTGAVANAR
ncbi:MAG TPA: TIGR03936 family radical SAM-associated protein [Mycobacteriales bacterium]|nr:TIGR03936 family radical SAM-associated protein [Mycobacteriales bacterium]